MRRAKQETCIAGSRRGAVRAAAAPCRSAATLQYMNMFKVGGPLQSATKTRTTYIAYVLFQLIV